MSPPLPLVPAVPPAPEGSPELVETLAVDLLAAAGVFAELGSFCLDGAEVPEWSGASARGYAATLIPRADAVEALARVLRLVAEAAQDWARDRRRLLGEHADLLAARGALEDLRAGILRDTARDPTAPDLEHRARHLRAGIVRWAGERDTLATQAVRADETLADTLRLARHPDAAVAMVAALPRLDAAGRPPLPLLVPGWGSPTLRRAWWAGLSGPLRAAYVARWPALVGGAGGLPAAVRDLANRILLRRDLQRLRALRDPDRRERRRLRELTDLERALERADDHRDPRNGRPVPVQLWLYDPDAHDGDGAVALAVGDLDTADNVAVQVPGFGNDLGSLATPGALSEHTLLDRMVDLHDAARTEDGVATTATMLWLGYDAPDNVPVLLDPGLDAATVLRDDAATAGAAVLRGDLQDLLAARGDDPHLTVLGHSYGSAVVGLALAGGGLEGVDDVVLLGSAGPGRGVDEASDLGDPGRVWVGRDSLDPVARVGDLDPLSRAAGGYGLGVDPAAEDFGARRFPAENPAARGDLLRHHLGYFDPGTESLENLTRVVVGEQDSVEVAAHVVDPWWGPAHDPEADWVRDRLVERGRDLAEEAVEGWRATHPPGLPSGWPGVRDG